MFNKISKITLTIFCYKKNKSISKSIFDVFINVKYEGWYVYFVLILLELFCVLIWLLKENDFIGGIFKNLPQLIISFNNNILRNCFIVILLKSFICYIVQSI